jgi:RimJ/RimL family protein N-acetyltransferase
MRSSKTLNFEGGYLRILDANDVHDQYVSGLNNTEINFFLDAVRGIEQTKEGIKNYVTLNADSENSLLWGVWVNEMNEHVGTVRVHGIDFRHRIASIGVCIFNKKAHGRGVGAKAIQIATQWTCENFDLRWVEAGIYAANYASQKSFERAGYEWILDFPGKYLHEGLPADIKIYAYKNST